jgi:hypothetical protein
MNNFTKFRRVPFISILPVLAAAALLFSGCWGPKTALSNIQRELSSRGILLWEDEITETPADKVTGYIMRGKTNLKITGGIISDEDLVTISRSINSAIGAAEGKPRLIKIDFSEAEVPAVFVFDSAGIGSLSLPSGLTELKIGLLSGTPFLLEIEFPKSGEASSLPGLEKLLITGAFYRVVIPANAGKIDIRSSNNFAAVFAEDRTSIDFTGTANFNSNRWRWRTQNPFFTVALPSTLLEISGTLTGCEELYSFAVEPPLATERGINQFPDLKTVYVPAGSEESYEEAWFNFTAAEFKTLPPGMLSMEQFIENWRPAPNNLGLTVRPER